MKITPERRMQDAGRQRIKQFPKALIEELLQVEINRHLGAQRYERSDDRRDWRNGSYDERSQRAAAPSKILRIPRTRNNAYDPSSSTATSVDQKAWMN